MTPTTVIVLTADLATQAAGQSSTDPSAFIAPIPLTDDTFYVSGSLLTDPRFPDKAAVLAQGVQKEFADIQSLIQQTS